MSLQKDIKLFSNTRFRMGYKQGIKAAADFVSMFDKQIAAGMNGVRLSDAILCKFNQTRRKHPRRICIEQQKAEVKA